ncbi:hypothetical protein DS2_01150 [Catenovulum agarivorans DS-2]|uniref:Uncharacterized protein n=1 Tax=Catenovulum agarivorans DS-2 TaxID=1328313 RepID=W7R3S6_9ALTE|nr:hypothetical protein [Catenovulum agarivorans]EWH12285.1 hypothetical protein DS2_01150 [Catenovulum agarivorans DS-2]
MINLPNIIDVEASGFGRGSYPIEVGVVLSSGRRFCSLIEPDESWTHWQRSAEDAHKISLQEVYLFGSSICSVADNLNCILRDQTVYSDAWGNDSSWIAKLFEFAGKVQAFKIESIVSILTEQQMEIWHDTKEALAAKSSQPRHRASNDAVLIQNTYYQTCAKLGLSKTIHVA